jgi:very-short-patch-repair endonuclease
MATVDARIAKLAERQGGHVTRAQLLQLGIGRGTTTDRLRRGSLIRVHQGVYAVGHLPTNPLDRAQGALLAAGPRSALAGRSAATLWGIQRHWAYPLELITANDRRPSGLIIHTTGSLLRRDIRTIDQVRVTSPARTVLDIAPTLTPNRLARAINDLRHDRGLTLRQLEDIVDRNPRHPGRPPINKVLGTSQREPTRSELENAFLRLLKRHRLPTPQINIHIAGFRVDTYFPDHNLIVEVDGWLTHQTRRAFAEDRRQDATILARTGIPTIRFTYEQTTSGHAETAAHLRTILNTRRRAGTKSP